MFKTCLQNKKLNLKLPSRQCHFHPILILFVEMVELLQQNANTTVYWLKTLPLPIVATGFKFCLWKHRHAQKLVGFCVKSGFVWKPVLIQNIANFVESHCVFLLLFTVWSIFDQYFWWLLPLSCFYGSSQWMFKVNITFKRVHFIIK